MPNWDFLLNAREQTGFSADVLEDIFIKYGGMETPIKTRKSLSQFLEFCKGYSTYRMFAFIREKLSFRIVCTKIKRILNYLYVIVNKSVVSFLNRLSSQNNVNIGKSSFN